MLFLAIIYLIEVFIVFFYTRSIYKPKYNSPISFIATVAGYALLYNMNIVFNNELLNVALMVVVNILLIKLFYDSSLKSSLFHGLVFAISVFASEFTVHYLSSLIMENPLDTLRLQSLTSMLLLFFISRVLARASIKENDGKSWGKWAGLAMLPFSSTLVLFTLRYVTKNLTLQKSEGVWVLVASVILFVANVAVYVIYEKAEMNTQKLMELELVHQKDEIDMQYLNLIEKKNQSMQVMAHDYKNHLLTISSMTESREIKEYINGLMGEISQLDSMGKTKNRFLDVVLSKYASLCEEKGVDLQIDIVTDNLAFMNNSDISSLFNNLLDNATESAEKSEQKKMLVQITNVLNSYRKIAVVNSCDAPPVTKNGELVTSKTNKEAHGFGTKSIKKIVDKYDGELDWEYDEEAKEFKLIILIPIDQ